MKIPQMTVSSYLDLLGSDTPAPGGGSASALCGAQGAALVAMVAGLTLGKSKYADNQELCLSVEKNATKLKNALVAQADEDAQAFNLVSAAFKLPKVTDEEKSARKAAIAAATLTATQVPFKTMELCLETLHYAKALVGHSNTNAASDLGVASLNLIAGIRGAWLNVLINLGGIGDEATAADYRRRGEQIVSEAEQESDEIYRNVIGNF